MNKMILLSLLACAILDPKPGFANPAMPAPAPVPVPENNPAYQNYLKRPKCELSKLMYLADRIKDSRTYKVIYKDREYEAALMAPIVRRYVAKNYKNESAQDWIKAHAYKTRDGRFIYVKYPGGRLRVLRDVLLEELKQLPSC
jgi:hypothetical protein